MYIPIFELIKQRYAAYDRKIKVNNYIKQVTKQPVDFQKNIFKEGLALIAVLFIIYLLATKAVFFTAVASGSMYPTFNKDDLVLMQNIDRRFNVGDIVMFERPDLGYPVSHRINLIIDQGIRTAGDATGQIDYWEIKKEDIIGKAILMQGKPIVIEGYGKFFIVESKDQDFGPFGKDYNNYFLFFQVVKIYGYVIAVVSLLLYIVLTIRQKPWQSR